jgi:hypothetical protein
MTMAVTVTVTQTVNYHVMSYDLINMFYSVTVTTSEWYKSTILHDFSQILELNATLFNSTIYMQ